SSQAGVSAGQASTVSPSQWTQLPSRHSGVAPLNVAQARSPSSTASHATHSPSTPHAGVPRSRQSMCSRQPTGPPVLPLSVPLELPLSVTSDVVLPEDVFDSPPPVVVSPKVVLAMLVDVEPS